MKLKPIKSTEDMKRILKNGDLKSKTRDEVIKLMESKKFDTTTIKDVLNYCDDKQIKFSKSKKQIVAPEKTARTRKKPNARNNLFTLYGAHIADYDLLSAEEESKLARKIVKGKKAKAELDFLDSTDIISAIPFSSILYLEDTYQKSVTELMNDHIQSLKQSVNEGLQARETFINSNLRLSYSIAKKHTATGISLEDLIQEANIGLMRAVDKFDPDRGFRFATMASWWIEQAVSRGISNKSRTIRVPVHIWEKTQKLKTFEYKYQQSNGEVPTIEEQAKFLKTTPERAAEIANSMAPLTSLDKELASKNRETTTLVNMIDDKKDTEDILNKQFLKETISDILDGMDLTETERAIFVNRFGLENTVPKTFPELQNMFDVPSSQATKIIKKIMEKFKSPDRMAMLQEFYAEC